METTFVRLESLTYFSLTPIPLFGSGYAELGFSETNLEYNFSFFLCVAASWRETLFFISARKNLAGILTKLLTKCRISLLAITSPTLPSPIDFHQPSTRVFDGEGMNLLGQRFLDEKMLSGCFLLFQVFC